MSVWRAWREGMAWGLRQKRIVVLLWVVDLVAAVGIVLPVFFLLQGALGQSLYADRLMKEMDLAWWMEQAGVGGSGAMVSGIWAVCVVLCLFLLHIFLSGGVFARLFTPEDDFSVERFFAGAGRYLGRFLRLSLLATEDSTKILRTLWRTTGRYLRAFFPLLALYLGIVALGWGSGGCRG